MTSCRAKNPQTCWYHAPNREELIKVQHTALSNMHTNIINTYTRLTTLRPEIAHEYLNEFLNISKLKEQSDIYYSGTDEGEKEILQKLEETEDLNEILKLENLRTLAVERRNLLESNPNQPDPVFPAHEKIFTFPEITTKTNKLLQPVEALGNKFNPTHEPQRIRAFIDSDIKRAKKLKFLPEELDFKVQYDHKTKNITVILDTENIEVARKIKKIANSYNRITFVPETSTVDKSFFNVRVVKRIVKEQNL